MNTQQTYNNRHHWLAVKQTIGVNTAPSFLDTGCLNYKQGKKTRYSEHIELQQTYYIDILAIFSKISIFFKGLSSFFTFSFQTDWQKDMKTITPKIIKSI